MFLPVVPSLPTFLQRIDDITYAAIPITDDLIPGLLQTQDPQNATAATELRLYVLNEIHEKGLINSFF
jgi:hypothetical protein